MNILTTFGSFEQTTPCKRVIILLLLVEQAVGSWSLCNLRFYSCVLAFSCHHSVQHGHVSFFLCCRRCAARPGATAARGQGKAARAGRGAGGSAIEQSGLRCNLRRLNAKSRHALEPSAVSQTAVFHLKKFLWLVVVCFAMAACRALIPSRVVPATGETYKTRFTYMFCVHRNICNAD